MKKLILALSALLMFASVLFAQNASLDCNDCFKGKKSKSSITGLHSCSGSGKDCMKK